MPDLRVITLVNRTPDPLSFTADGQHHVLQPGENHGHFAWQAYYAKSQNPLFGSENYHTLEYQSLVGVKGEDDCTPYTDDELLAASEKVERFDREADGLRPGRVLPNRHSPLGRGAASLANGNAFAIGRG